jgi:hypothetical protein
MCGVGLSDDILCSDSGNVSKPNWFLVPGKLRQLSVSNGRIYGVNAGGQILYLTDARKGKWVQLNGSGINIAHNSVTDEICFTDSSTQIWCGKH